MKIIEPYKQLKDSRGSFLGVVNSGQWEELNYVETTAGQVRGGHYHKETRELFFIIDGEIDITVSGMAEDKITTFSVCKGSVFVIEPFEVHTFSCKTDCKWINLLSKRIDDQSNDIHLLDQNGTK